MTCCLGLNSAAGGTRRVSVNTRTVHRTHVVNESSLSCIRSSAALFEKSDIILEALSRWVIGVHLRQKPTPTATRLPRYHEQD